MGSTTKRGYWFPAGNDAVNLFPGQNELLFMKKLDTDMHTALTANIAAARIPNLAASKITSGRFSDARIPSTVARTETVLAATEALSRRIDDLAALKDRIEELESATRTTGRRDVSSLMENADGGTVRVDRIGDIVELSIYGVEPDGPVGNTVINVFGDNGFPDGFRPRSSLVFPLSTVEYPGDGIITRTYASSWGRMSMNNPGTPLYGNVTFVTGDAWPSTLPGDPA